MIGALVGFADALRRLGVEVGVSRIETGTRAVATVDPRDRDAVYWALRCSLLSRHEEAEAFDAVFDAFWAGSLPAPAPAPPEDATPPPGPEGAEEPPAPPDSVLRSERMESDAGEAEAPSSAGGWSSVERLRRMDFADYGPEELALARRLIRRLANAFPRRLSRRSRPAVRGGRLDRRATLRAAMRSDGHPLELAWRDRAAVPRKLVFLLDVSGSMEPYARVMLIFLQAVRQGSSGVEAFAFGTRLTRLTRELAGPDAERALERVAGAVPDWAGGTRIGAALQSYEFAWGRRGLTRGAVVVIVSDGWERGDLGLLGLQMSRLQRAAHTVVWVNPLAGHPGYRPLAAGMATALPFVDVFLAGHDLHRLEVLAEVLAELPSGRTRRALGAGPARRRVAGEPPQGTVRSGERTAGPGSWRAAV